ncbi:hypothetical protein ACMHYO_07475 [Allopusillimonas ginsengisoli]|uniref:IS66 family transposase n=1 Tax=Allopusillimonas ginsengisoli TaxID=453575 RepID=UPI0039C10796
MFGQKSEKLLRQIDQLELELEEQHINQGERAQKAESIARRVAASRRRHERSAGVHPLSLRVVCHVRPRLSCRYCDRMVAQPPAPSRQGGCLS